MSCQLDHAIVYPLLHVYYKEIDHSPRECRFARAPSEVGVSIARCSPFSKPLESDVENTFLGATPEPRLWRDGRGRRKRGGCAIEIFEDGEKDKDRNGNYDKRGRQIVILHHKEVV